MKGLDRDLREYFGFDEEDRDDEHNQQQQPRPLRLPLPLPQQTTTTTPSTLYFCKKKYHPKYKHNLCFITVSFYFFSCNQFHEKITIFKKIIVNYVFTECIPCVLKSTTYMLKLKESLLYT